MGAGGSPCLPTEVRGGENSGWANRDWERSSSAVKPSRSCSSSRTSSKGWASSPPGHNCFGFFVVRPFFGMGDVDIDDDAVDAGLPVALSGDKMEVGDALEVGFWGRVGVREAGGGDVDAAFTDAPMMASIESLSSSDDNARYLRVDGPSRLPAVRGGKVGPEATDGDATSP